MLSDYTVSMGVGFSIIAFGQYAIGVDTSVAIIVPIFGDFFFAIHLVAAAELGFVTITLAAITLEFARMSTDVPDMTPFPDCG